MRLLRRKRAANRATSEVRASQPEPRYELWLPSGQVVTVLGLDSLASLLGLLRGTESLDNIVLHVDGEHRRELSTEEVVAVMERLEFQERWSETASTR